MLEKSRKILEVYAPSALADEPSSRVSERYRLVPTTDIVEELEQWGWEISSASQKKVLSQLNPKWGKQKHIVRFRNPSFQEEDLAPEGVVVNSHDALSQFGFYKGMHIFVCANGLVSGATEGFKSIHIESRSSLIRTAIEGIVASFEKTVKEIQTYKTIEMKKVDMDTFALEAAQLRWENYQVRGIIREDLLKPRRAEDQENSLWKVFNRVQENLMKGGVRMHLDGTGRNIRETGAITSVDKDIAINVGMWALLQKYAGKR